MSSSIASQGRISEATAAEQRAHEPSMEEILASIRRIIADDQMLPLTRTPATPAPVRAPDPALERAAVAVMEELALMDDAPRLDASTRPVEAPAPRIEMPAPEAVAPRVEPPQLAIPQEVAPLVRPEPEPVVKAFVPSRPPVAPSPPAPVVAEPEPAPLLSPERGASVSSAFNALASTMVLQNQGMIEEATREMLRPMLKQWLDDNLPVMVERLVRHEIERVARGGR